MSLSRHPNSPWSVAPPSLALEVNEVHVWRAALDADPDVQKLERLLSDDERERAERFVFDKHRRRFIVGRGVLRALLGRYVNQQPERIRFVYGAEGKPALAAQTGRDQVHFNLSHSEELALYAFTRDREIGIDVEWMNPGVAIEELAQRFFSPGEVATLSALPAEARRQAFFACWSRKEAYMKATGKGLSLPTREFEVTLSPGEPAALVSTRHDPKQAKRWSFLELDAGPAFAAAVAVEGRGWSLKCWQWHGFP